MCLLYLGSASGWATLFTFSAEGPLETSDGAVGAAKAEVRRKVVVRRWWSFMVKATRLRSSKVLPLLPIHQRRAPAIDLELDLGSSESENESCKETSCTVGVRS